jgi:septal ring factor EnvC (AmiA/AmiB activator)
MESSKETGDLDTQSMGSAAPSDVSKGKKGKGANSKSSDLEKELKREKKFKKLLKEALEEEKEKVAKLQKEIEWCNLKNQELENENREHKTKYHDLYMENS